MKPETKNTFKENVLLIVSYVLSKILQFLFKCNVYIFGLAEGDDDVTLQYAQYTYSKWIKMPRWTHLNPFSGAEDPNWYSSYYFDTIHNMWDKIGGRYLYGKFSHAVQADFNINKALWLLELDKNKLQEIDVMEFMQPNRNIINWINEKIKQVNAKFKWNISELPNPPVRGVYFSIYNNEVSNRYYIDDDKSKPIYRRFQTRMRSKYICDCLTYQKVNYSIKWKKNYVMWYIEDMPVAISFVYIPTQPMFLILSNIV
jgi:hypothetical protein